MSHAIDEARKLAKRIKRNSLQDKFLAAWRATDWPEPMVEVAFHVSRKWRFDFAWREGIRWALAVELHGGTFVRGAHSRGGHQSSDFEKLNEAQRLGWVVLQFGTDACKDMAEVVRVVQETMAELSKRQTEYLD